MEKIILKHEILCRALDRLKEAVEDFDKITEISQKLENWNKKRLHDSLRDSMIQRFEFCIDLFWKYIKLVIEEKHKKKPEYNSPKATIKIACNTKLITEEDTEKMLKMLDDRNQSSHIYKEEVANQISARIKNHYSLMRKYIDQLTS